MSCPKPCKNCGLDLWVVLAGKKTNYIKNRDFCSIACRAAHQKATGSLRILPEKVCPVCSATFRPVTRKAVCCSKRCQNLKHRKAMAGVANPNYSHGAQTGAHRRRFRKVFSPMLRMALPACSLCGRKTGLVVHHLNENAQDDRLENAVVLCRECHMTFHKTEAPEIRESIASRLTKITASYAEILTVEQIRSLRDALA